MHVSKPYVPLLLQDLMDFSNMRRLMQKLREEMIIFILFVEP